MGNGGHEQYFSGPTVLCAKGEPKRRLKHHLNVMGESQFRFQPVADSGPLSAMSSCSPSSDQVSCLVFPGYDHSTSAKSAPG